MPLVRVPGNGTTPGSSLWFWCPGCDDSHRITVGTPDSWTWDGNETAPTINPSILVQGVQWPRESGFYKPNHKVDAGEAIRCHSFIRAGRWEFLADCTHILAGQAVPMVPLPDWFNDD